MLTCVSNVLILVVVDDGLVPVNVTRILSQSCVLILVVVDDGLVHHGHFKDSQSL